MSIKRFQKHVLVTGGTGFVGSRLLKALLKYRPDCRITVLVYPQDRTKASKIDQQIKQAFETPLINWVLGDITLPGLGLPDKYYQYLTKTVEEIFHLAAFYHLNSSADLAWQVNYVGSQNMVTFANDCEKLEKFHHFSSLVAGKMKPSYDIQLEPTWLGKKTRRAKPKRPFLNHYERTKYLSEVLIQENLKDRVPVLNIFRPGIVVGDSKYGLTDKFDGFYYLLLFLWFGKQYLSRIPLRVLGKNKNFPIIPVDYVANAAALISDQWREGIHIFPLAPEKPLDWNDLYPLIFRKVIGKNPKFKITTRSLKFLVNSSKIPLTFDFPRTALGFVDHEIAYDMRPTQEALKHTQVSAPNFPDYAEKVIQFFLDRVARYQDFLPINHNAYAYAHTQNTLPDADTSAPLLIQTYN